MEEFLNKKYKFDKTDDNFNEYLSEIGKINTQSIDTQGKTKFPHVSGLNVINRKLARTIPSSTQIVKLSETEYGLNTILPFKTHQQKFIPGQETENMTIDGRKVKNIFTIEGNKLIEKQVEPKREVTLIREFFEKQMLGQSIVGKVTNNSVSSLVE